MCFERDIYHNQGIDENNMIQVHFENNVYQNKCPNIGDYETIYGSTQMSIVTQIGLAIWMTTNPHEVKFSY